MSVQHVFHGEGNPNDLGIIAPAGSHFVNDLDSDEVWIATYSEPADGESPAYTGWIKLLEKWPAFTTAQAMYEIAGLGAADLIMQANPSELRISGNHTIFSNVELTQNAASGYSSYSAAGPFRAVAELTAGGEMVLTITPLFESALP